MLRTLNISQDGMRISLAVSETEITAWPGLTLWGQDSWERKSPGGLGEALTLHTTPWALGLKEPPLSRREGKKRAGQLTSSAPVPLVTSLCSFAPFFFFFLWILFPRCHKLVNSIICLFPLRIFEAFTLFRNPSLIFVSVCHHKLVDDFYAFSAPLVSCGGCHCTSKNRLLCMKPELAFAHTVPRFFAISLFSFLSHLFHHSFNRTLWKRGYVNGGLKSGKENKEAYETLNIRLLQGWVASSQIYIHFFVLFIVL